MSITQSTVPTPGGPLALTDSGIETDLVFNHGIDLPEFASFPLLRQEVGRALLETYYRAHAEVAAKHGTGFVFETPTWRSNHDWGTRLGYDQADLDAFDRDAVELVRGVRGAVPGLTGATTISGLLGPRGDGYAVGAVMTAQESSRYHAHQVEVFAGAGCDMVSALTMTYAAEAAGIVLAAREASMPVAVSFTVETDGRLPDGTSLRDAVRAVDEATEGYAAYLGINCAHPDHVRAAVADGGSWTERISWLRANASRQSHAELDAAEVLDDGDPVEFAAGCADLRASFPRMTVVGGCCGTDVRHVRALADAIVG